MDQNEKLGMFGVTHVLAVDGFSSKIVATSTMPVKNNLVIYERVYRQVGNPLYQCHMSAQTQMCCSLQVIAYK